VDDADLADYNGAAPRFRSAGPGRRVDWNDDQRHRYLVDIVADLDATRANGGSGDGASERYALWLAGVFRTSSPPVASAGRPGLGYYDSLGAVATRWPDHALADQLGLEAVFRTAAERFQVVRGALTALSDRVFFPNVVTVDRVERAAQRGDGLLA
jgi:hypothetical protein